MAWFFGFFLVSGFCSVLCELIWLRLAMAQFGVTTALTSIVLSVFMAGLGAGSWLAGTLVRRYGDRIRSSPLRLYAVLELLIGLSLFLGRTPYGVQMRAAAEDFRMARYLGIKANFVIGLAFAISGVLAAMTSLLFVSQTGTLSHMMGVPLMLFAFIATVIGGMGSLAGAVVGGFAVGFVSVMLQAYLPQELRSFRDAFVFAVVIMVLLFRPSGLIPTKALAQRV